MTKKELLSEYHKIAKAADRRLRNLEKASMQQDFRDAKRWAYASAMKDIEARFGDGINRFDRKLPDQIKKTSIISAINDVKKFMEAPSSTKTGIIETYRKRAESLNAKYPGLNATWQQLAKLFENNTFDNMLSKMTSAQIFKQIAKKKTSDRKDISRKIREADDKIKRVSDNQIFDAILSELEASELSISDLA